MASRWRVSRRDCSSASSGSRQARIRLAVSRLVGPCRAVGDAARGTISPEECSQRPRARSPAERGNSVPRNDPFGARASLGVGLPDFYRLAAVADLGVDLARAPFTLKILLENVLRHAGGGVVRE